jgi:hypothetical protein
MALCWRSSQRFALTFGTFQLPEHAGSTPGVA